MAQRTCPYCGTTMTNPRRVQCGADECRRAHTAQRMRGYMRERRGTCQSFDCQHCGQRCVPGENVSIYAETFCGQECKAAHHNAAGRPARRRAAAEGRLARAARGTGSNHVTYGCCCPECGATFLSRYPPHEAGRYCSHACRIRQKGRRRRARMAGAESRTLSFRDVATRDGWRCQLCGHDVDPTLKVPHLLAPTLDHVVALVLGGAHSLHLQLSQGRFRRATRGGDGAK